MANTITKVKENEEHLLNLLKNQTSIVDSTFNILKSDQEAVKAKFDHIDNLLSQVNKRVSNVSDELYQEHVYRVFSSLCIQLTIIAANLQQTQSAIFNVLTNTHHGIISPLLLTPIQLQHEVDKIRFHLPESLDLPVRQPFHRGSFLIDNICEQLRIKEKDYFGLRYADISKQRHWLDVDKSILKQCKDVDQILFSFRVKFYPADPFRLTSNGRIMLYQQLKRDLRHGRIYCSFGEAAALGSLIVQEELGDFIEEIHTENYVSSMNLALRQTDSLEKKIIELHKKREPFQDPSETMDEFMGIVSGLETYGIDPHPVKDHRGSQLYIGINYSGISTFISGKRSQHFRWNEIQKLNFEGKMFIAHLSYTDASREPKKHTIGFKCTSNVACRYLWRCAIEQMLFFTLPNSQNAAVVSGGGFFSWGTKFKYTGRTEREILTESINAIRDQKLAFISTNNRKASSVPTTPSSPQGDIEQIRYSSLPRSTMSEPLNNYIAGIREGISNVGYCQGYSMYDDNHRNTTQLDDIEPNTKEEHFKAFPSFNNQNIAGIFSVKGDTSNFSNRSDDILAYSSPVPVKTYGCESHKIKKNAGHVANYELLKYNSTDENSSKYSKAKVDRSNSDIMEINRNCINRSKGSRKFRFIHAFVPSFIFVVLAMLVSAIVVLESESDILKKFRNLPEMISLRFQYYQPIKDYFLRHVGRKT